MPGRTEILPRVNPGLTVWRYGTRRFSGTQVENIPLKALFTLAIRRIHAAFTAVRYHRLCSLGLLRT
jgi:hypothetical protein